MKINNLPNIYIMITFLLLVNMARGQEFIKITENQNRVRIVKYVDERYPTRIPIILYKITNLDTDSTQYSIGLFVYAVASTDQFMRDLKRAYIKFDDGTKMNLLEDVAVNYVRAAGMSQLAVKHILSEEEFLKLQTKTVDYISIDNIQSNVEMFEKKELIKVFTNIVSK